MNLKPYEFNEKYFDILKGSDYEALKKDIEKRGILNSLHVLPDGTVICGNQRLKIANELGITHTQIPIKIVTSVKTDEEIKEYLIKDNLLRRHLTPEQRAPLYDEMSKLYERPAVVSTGEVNMTSPHEMDVNERTAKEVNVSPKTIQRARAYVKATENKPEWQGKNITWVLGQVKKEKLENNRPELPKEKFDIIYADPPWKYDFSKSGSRSIEAHYPPMNLEEIKSMEIPAADDSILFLWTTTTKIDEGIEVIKSWGFDYKTSFVWVKDKIGMGFYCRGQHELLFVATKGKPGTPLSEDLYSSVIEAPRREHSEKPDIVYDMIEKMYPNRKYLELFARKKREGWIGWGKEYE